MWTNVRIGNSLLLEYELDEDARLTSVVLLSHGLPNIFNLSLSSVLTGQRQALNKDSRLSYYQFETLA